MDYEKAREELRKWMVEYTDCDLQTGSGGAWPCETCTATLLKSIGLALTDPQYSEHNDEVYHFNEVWRAILQIRDAKLTPTEVKRGG